MAQPPGREAFTSLYPALWEGIIAAWSAPGADCAWLTYSANYLLRTGGTRWAVDPFVPLGRVEGAPPVDMSALARLDFVLLTHRHADHFHAGLVSALRNAPIHWVTPASLLADVRSAGISAARISVPQAGKAMDFGGVRITPFDGLHLRNGRGVPSTGCLAEFNGRRWLFPGDTRTYDAANIPPFGALDGMFAHVWLGRGQALMEAPPLLEAFCRFCLDLQPRRIVLTHLNDYGRSDEDRWTARHAQMAQARLTQLRPETSVQPAEAGDIVLLE